MTSVFMNLKLIVPKKYKPIFNFVYLLPRLIKDWSHAFSREVQINFYQFSFYLTIFRLYFLVCQIANMICQFSA